MDPDKIHVENIIHETGNTDINSTLKETDKEKNENISTSNNHCTETESKKEDIVDECVVQKTAERLNELDKSIRINDPINIEFSNAEVIMNDNTQNSDSGFPNGSLEKMSIIDDETKLSTVSTRKQNDQLDSDDDSEPPVVETNMKINSDKESALLKKSDKSSDMIVDDEEDSGGGTSYETAGSSAASQCDKPSPFKGTLAEKNGSRCEGNTSNLSLSRGSRGRKRINIRHRLSSSSSSTSSSRTSLSSSTSSATSLDSDDDSKSSVDNSSPSTSLESWRKKNLSSRCKKNQTVKIEKPESVSDQKEMEQEQNENHGEISKKDRKDEDSEINNGKASTSTTPGKKKKKKKSKKRHRLEKRKKRSDSQSSKSSDTFVSLEDIPCTTELQDPGFRVLRSSVQEKPKTEDVASRGNSDNVNENLSDNEPSDNDDDMTSGNQRQRHDSSSSSSSSSVSTDAIFRQARFGPRNRMMRARIRAQEEEARENEPEDRPPPEVLSKPAAQNKYSFFKDFIKRQYDSRPTYPWYTNNRIGSLDIVKRFELSKKLEGHEGCVNALHFNESGSRLASGSDDKEIIVWDWEKGKKSVSFPSGHHSNVFQSKFLPLTGDTHLVSTSRDGQVRLAVLSTTGVCRSTKRLAQHKGPANKLALLPQCPHTFISCGEDGVLYTVDVREQKPGKLLVQKDPGPISGGGNGANSISTGKTIPVYTVNANPLNDNLIATAGRDPHVRVYDRRFATEENNQPVKKFCPRHLVDNESRASITCAVWNYNGTEILASYNDDDIYLFDSSHSDGSDYIKRYQGHRNSATVKGVNFYGGKSEFIVSGSDCGNIFFWDKENEGIVHMMSGDVHGVVNVLEPHPSLPVLATSGLDDDVKIWMPTSNEETSVADIERAVMKNAKDRRENSLLEPDFFDSQMLWVMLRHLRSDRRRRERAADRDGDNDDPREETDSVSEEDQDASRGESDSDDGGGMPQCPQS